MTRVYAECFNFIVNGDHYSVQDDGLLGKEIEQERTGSTEEDEEEEGETSERQTRLPDAGGGWVGEDTGAPAKTRWASVCDGNK